METAKVIRKSYKFRIYPTKAQVGRLKMTLDLCRELYNAALQERRDAYDLNRISISYFDQSKQLPEIKKIREDLKSVYSQVLCDVLRRCEKAYDGYYRRVKLKEKAGKPRFKGENRFNSFTYPQNANSAFFLDNNKLHLSKIGKVKIKLHRQITGKIKNCTIKRDSTGKWFANFVVECEKELLTKTSKSVGLDVGLTHFATLSNGETISNPRFFKTNEKILAKAQRKLSLQKTGSIEFKKRKKVVARIYAKIRNNRLNFGHQVSRKLVNSYDEIFFEALTIQNLLQNSHLSKAIADAFWCMTIEFTRYKAENAGRLFALVNPKNTSQNCSGCGQFVAKDLSVKIHDCHNCGLKMDRDLNAAKNILTLGLQSLDLS